MSVSTAQTDRRGLSGPVLLGGVFLLTVGIGIAFNIADIVVNNVDANRPEGPIDSIRTIAVVSIAALAIALAIVLPLRSDPDKARFGAIVLGLLSLISLPFFWSGAPAIFGAASAWLAGLVTGVQPQTGVARGFGVVGLVIAVLLVVATPVLYISSFLAA